MASDVTIIFTIVFKSFFITGAIAIVDSYFGHSTSPTLLDRVQCLGNEATLLSCQHSSVYSNNYYYYYYYDYYYYDYYYYDYYYYCDNAGVRCSGMYYIYIHKIKLYSLSETDCFVIIIMYYGVL